MGSSPTASIDHEYYMRMALSEARVAFETKNLPIAAVIVFRGQILGKAYNRVVGDKNLLAHAEFRALNAAAETLNRMHIKDRGDTILYATLEPCMMCFGAIMNFNLGHICYALRSPGDGVLPIVHQWRRKSEQLPFYTVPSIIHDVLRDESAELLLEFSRRFPNSRFARWSTQLASLRHG